MVMANNGPMQNTRPAFKQIHSQGTTNKTELLSVVLNNSTLEKPFYNIKETDGVITF